MTVSASLLLLLSLLFSYDISLSTANNDLDSAITSLYNYDFEESLSSLEKGRSKDPKHPLIDFLVTTNKWLSTQSSKGFVESYDSLRYYADISEERYLDLVSQYPDVGEYRLYLGSLYGLRSRVSLGNKDWIDAFYYAYYGHSYVQQAYEINPNIEDINLTFGMMEYFMCRSSRYIQVLGSAFGVSSDCENALSKMERAVSNSRYSRVEAMNTLTYAYLHFEQEPDLAHPHIETLYSEFPGHPYFKFLYAESLIKNGYIDDARIMVKELENVVANSVAYQKVECSTKLDYINLLLRFGDGDYQEAIIKATEIIDSYSMEMDWVLLFSYIIRAKSYDLIGERRKAADNFRVASRMNSYYKASKQAKIYIKTPYTYRVD